MKIGITGPGNPRMTKVYNMETGEEIQGVTRLEYVIGANSDSANVHLTVEPAAVNLLGDLRGVQVEINQTALWANLQVWLARWHHQIPPEAQKALEQILNPTYP